MTDISTEQGQIGTTPHAGRYRIDPSRSIVAFKTRHLFGIAPVRGTFTIAAGTVDVADPAAQSSIRVDIGHRQFPHRQSTTRCRRQGDTPVTREITTPERTPWSKEPAAR